MTPSVLQGFFGVSMSSLGPNKVFGTGADGGLGIFSGLPTPPGDGPTYALISQSAGALLWVLDADFIGGITRIVPQPDQDGTTTVLLYDPASDTVSWVPYTINPTTHALTITP